MMNNIKACVKKDNDFKRFSLIANIALREVCETNKEALLSAGFQEKDIEDFENMIGDKG